MIYHWRHAPDLPIPYVSAFILVTCCGTRRTSDYARISGKYPPCHFRPFASARPRYARNRLVR
jgi:hypothetical protein